MIDELAKTLKKAFPHHKIYSENVEQGLKTPCFSIMLLSAYGNRELGNRYKNTFQFLIRYFPANDNDFEDCCQMLRNLLILLVDVGKHHATKLNGEIVDGILHFEAVYPEFTSELSDVDDMSEYTHSICGVKVSG